MDDLYFRQIQAGPMENFVYLIGNQRTRKCVLVDPAWVIDGLLKQIDEDDMNLCGALITHYHPDHCGGSMYGFTVEGLPTLMEKRPVPIYVNEHEADGLMKVTGVSKTDLKIQSTGDTLDLDGLPITFLHTPGHTPGSQCFQVGKRLVSGDTLFVQGCGRVDLPGGDPEVMYHTLTKKLATLPDDTILCPGHFYGSEPMGTMGEIKETNHYLRIPSLEAWMRLMGH